MADEGRPQRLTWSEDAMKDMAGIYLHSLINWGARQAKRYELFLEFEAHLLLTSPNRGRIVPERPDLRRMFVRWTKAKYGHNLVFKRDGDGVTIIRVLHSTRDLSQHLPDG